jgi:hypothetical protein
MGNCLRGSNPKFVRRHWPHKLQHLLANIRMHNLLGFSLGAGIEFLAIVRRVVAVEVWQQCGSAWRECGVRLSGWTSTAPPFFSNFRRVEQRILQRRRRCPLLTKC